MESRLPGGSGPGRGLSSRQDTRKSRAPGAGSCVSTRWDHLEHPGVKPNSVWGRKQEMGALEVGRLRA